MTDVAGRPTWIDQAATISVTQANGNKLVYDRNHVITTDIFNKSDFLQALERTGLFVQNSFAQNGLPMISEINGATATAAPDALRSEVSGASHTGGHGRFDVDQKIIIDAFDAAYEKAAKAFPGVQECPYGDSYRF